MKRSLPALPWLGAALLSVGALWWIYANVVTFGFLHWDDRLHIQENQAVHALSAANLWWMLTTMEIDYWRPLSFFSHAIDFALYDTDAGWHHVTSVVLHGINALLVAQLARVILEQHFRAWSSRARTVTGAAAGLLFAVHPQHVETVAWLSERDGVLCVTFYLAAALAYASPHSHPNRRMVTVLALFFLALLSKPLALSLPLVLLAMDVFPLQRFGYGQRWRTALHLVAEKWHFWLLMLLVIGVTYLGVVGVDGAASLAEVPFAERIVNAARSFWLYPYRFLVPLGLSPFYPMELLDNSLAAGNLLAPAAMMLLIGVGLLRLWRGRGALLAITAMYLAMVGPTLGLVHLGAISSADRYAYLPGAVFSIGLAIAIGALLQRLPSLSIRRVILVACVVSMVGVALLARQQVQVWRDDFTLWRTVLSYHPTWRPHRYISEGIAAYGEGRFHDAIGLLTQAEAEGKRPGDINLYLALSYQGLGDNEMAIYHTERGLEAGERLPGYLILGVRVHMDGKRFPQARALMRELDAALPDNPDSRRLSASLELEAGNFETAAEILDEAMDLFDVTPATLVLRGVVEHRRGHLESARDYYARALQMQPGLIDAENNLRTLETQLSRTGGRQP
ncbi:MAG: tetratricopeptide repeat protein [Pseudomonadota bacterium]